MTITPFATEVEAIRRGESVEVSAQRLVEQLTDAERIGLLDGDQPFWPGVLSWAQHGYNYVPVVAGAVARLGLPGFRFTDGPRGISVGRSTCFPVTMARGATWDPELEERVGVALGLEARVQGANLYGGVVHVTVHQRSGVVNLDFSLDSLQLAQNAQLRSFGAVVKGNLSGSGAAQINGPNLPDDQATMAVNGDQIEVAIVDGFPPIHLGTLTGNLQLDQAAVKLSGIVAHGDDLDLKADGTIQLGETLDDSTINLTFYLTPTQNGLDHFGFFLKMLPHPPGPDAPFTVDGNLLSPSIS